MSNQFNNVIMYDNAGKPSMMVRVPKFNLSDVIDGAPNIPHPAFVVDGMEVPEIYISKYQNIVVKGRAYSLPFQKPEVNVNFDEARQVCERKGDGWHLMTNAEWAAIALWAKKNGTLPRGNNDWGKDRIHKNEKGIMFNSCKILTGSGPDAWSHDHTPQGIFDLNGNVWEWVSGLRLMDGEIQIIPDNNAVKQVDQSAESIEWKPILLNGESIKYSETDNGMKMTTEDADGWSGCRFSELVANIEVPITMKALGLFPVDEEELTDYFWAAAEGERLPSRGGYWGGGAVAGVFCMYLSNPRSGSGSGIGFRSAFVKL